MNGLLDEFGRRLAERWAGLLVFPGLLFLGSLAAAASLGGVRSDGAAKAIRRFLHLLADAGIPQPATGIVVAGSLISILLASAAAGLTAQGLGSLAGHWWSRAWPRWTAPIAGPLVRWRQRRWTAAQQRFLGASKQAVADGLRNELAAARNAVGLQPPQRPTWIADRMLAADVRVWQEYGLDLASCWPRLWLVVPEAARSAVDSARERWTAATVLAGWAALYALLAVLWTPTLLVAAALWVIGWRRARVAASGLADLVEAVIDMHGPALATAVGLAGDDGRLDRSVGLQITQRFRKSA